MLAAAVSGLLMHRHLLRDIFTLRPGAQRLVSRRDLHTVAGTWILPHAFVLAFTGAFFSFAISVGVPVLAKIAFNGNQPAMIEALIGIQKTARSPPSGQREPRHHPGGRLPARQRTDRFGFDRPLGSGRRAHHHPAPPAGRLADADDPDLCGRDRRVHRREADPRHQAVDRRLGVRPHGSRCISATSPAGGRKPSGSRSARRAPMSPGAGSRSGSGAARRSRAGARSAG